MQRIPIRELRNHASQVVRRVKAGERIVVTVDGIPAAQIVPLNETSAERSLDDLIASGMVLPRRVAAPVDAPSPIRAPGRRSSTAILREHRDR